jgi:hypothetical protein
MRHKILLGLTTTPRSDWREKIKEIDTYKIKEVALFLTFLNIESRKELYALLEKSSLDKTPHIHLRDDMEKWEIDYLSTRWKVRFFNIHPNWLFFEQLQNWGIEKKVYVENLNRIDATFEKISKLSGGICLDFSHWEMHHTKNNNGYIKLKKLLEEFPVECCHISSIKNWFGLFKKDDHLMHKIEHLNYIKNYLSWLPETISIELENSFCQQLEVQKYLEKIIN